MDGERAEGGHDLVARRKPVGLQQLLVVVFHMCGHLELELRQWMAGGVGDVGIDMLTNM